eukprot:CAMPEP_0167756736 /NCGR_PEP_ID=MMETSP0110_2-20121227/9547_1 /TAXON_ID=629695 /ORGANISM="Gymnochlora sp., Strain CCMP2014" /LENGTH=51 /DNA_ID=CAMNT_0007642871 /DNA_START=206 /DNA_END=362 /DNA_ORIENTATION=-
MQMVIVEGNGGDGAVVLVPMENVSIPIQMFIEESIGFDMEDIFETHRTSSA